MAKTSVASASKKGPLSSLTKDLLLDRSQFTGFSGDQWKSDLGRGSAPTEGPAPGSYGTTSPQECSTLDTGKPTGSLAGTQAASSELSDTDPEGTHMASVSLTLPAPDLDVKRYIDRCGQYTITSDVGGQTLTQTVTLRLLQPSGLPKWATAYGTTIDSNSPIPGLAPLHGYTVMVRGAYRDVLVNAVQFTMSHDAGYDAAGVAGQLTTLFNAQVAKLEAAP
ncbi:hypothetical protein KIH27_04185 [Mycobacterium sp. M1]|uniref:PknH-like extracellular domain-containing protein n=1 Tax=Mycolicibacter acidiphilus TaxID=2835306 RepID=A0ABS5RET3_9MYCO|nr:hypothetical protein [Mycolicibacter acidiphilus]MBS9532785.1 hypothetical protein [Mycolicibacter acidiphilus]